MSTPQADNCFSVRISHCANINDGEFTIRQNYLNIKYGANGTGKSTIASALLSLDDTSGIDLEQLRPFKLVSDPSKHPTLSGCNGLSRVAIFNEDYISKYLFHEEELMSRSFEILIEDEEYKSNEERIGSLIATLTRTFVEEDSLSTLINSANSLVNALGQPTKNGFRKSSSILKASIISGVVSDVPSDVIEYAEFIQNKERNVEWVGWQAKGAAFSEHSIKCPYCVSNIEERKEKIGKIAELYNSASVKHHNKSREIIEGLGNFLTDSTLEYLTNIFGKSPWVEEDSQFVLEVFSQAEAFSAKLNSIKQFKLSPKFEISEIPELLSKLAIVLGLYSHFQAEKVSNLVKIINERIEGLVIEARDLQSAIAKQKSKLVKAISTHEDLINDFLITAGFKYSVKILDQNDDVFKLRLKHEDSTGTIESGGQYLSYGEKNAFALVLFMCQCISENPDLIVLDDPISSFDRTKKFAVLDKLFRTTDSFRGRTVLLLTHDFEPIIDLVYNHPREFDKIFCHFISNSLGQLIEKEISKSDIKTLSELLVSKLYDLEAGINQVVILRRAVELHPSNDNSFAILSSLIHRRSTPSHLVDGVSIALDETELESGLDLIKSICPDFDYEETLNAIGDDLSIVNAYKNANSNYEKLQIFRFLFDGVLKSALKNRVARKFINMPFHIENDYLFQLDPTDFNSVPEHIVLICDNCVAEHFESQSTI